MFTGIIEEVGMVNEILKAENSVRLSIHAPNILSDGSSEVKTGDSIAVNGICLTVTSRNDSSFTADVMPETLNRSALADLKRKSPVNLERAMSANGRFGGHIVTGHIDGIGTITTIRQDNIAIWYTIRTTGKIVGYIVEKGSIAIDGISLTVAAVQPDSFSVSVIPHTQKHTALATRRVGSRVNLENDCIAKYIEKFLLRENGGRITREFLAQKGFL